MCRPIRGCWSAQGHEAANRLASRVFTLLLISQIVLLVAALIYTDELVALIAPGFSAHPEKFALAVGMTRITFPYLAFITLATLHSGTLNAHGYFSAAAFAPVLLNLFVVGIPRPRLPLSQRRRRGVLGRARLRSRPARAADGGSAPARRARATRRAAARPDVKQFFAALGPAVIGSAGQQIAILADTILASLLPNNANSSMYYAERLYQLPLGVIGVAAGTVLLPEMSRRLAAGDTRGAAAAQNRSIALTFALAAPFFVAFLVLPEETMRGAFLRGAFTAEAARGSAAVLAAYGLGLAPMVLIRSAVASFQSRGDTTTPMLCFFAGLAVNLALKLALYQADGTRRPRPGDRGRRLDQFRPADCARDAAAMVRARQAADREHRHRRPRRRRRLVRRAVLFPRRRPLPRPPAVAAQRTRHRGRRAAGVRRLCGRLRAWRARLRPLCAKAIAVTKNLACPPVRLC